MRRKSSFLAFLGIVALMISPSLKAWGQDSHPKPQYDEQAVRSLMNEWVAAYKGLDAKRLAALEVPNVETVDRFGDSHEPVGQAENEGLWSDTFDVISRSTEPPRTTIDHIRFLTPDSAIVEMSWQFASGILLTDATRIPPYSQLDIYVLTRSHGKWLVSAHFMQEKKA